jgi:hypothetical protein
MPQPSRYITARITFRRATTKEWENNDPVLLSGEPAIDTTANKFKIGDGISPWSSLDYVDGGAGGGGGSFWVNNGNFPEAVTNAAEAIDYLKFWQDTFEDNAAAYFNTGVDGGDFVPLHELNISAGTGGAASILGEPADFNSYPEGTQVQIQALTFSNYEFSSWSGLLAGEENKALTTITMSGPRVLGAEFVVEAPNQAPDVTLNGDAVITVYEGGGFSDPGAIYVDDKDGTGVAAASGIVDVDTLGQYTITYTYTDTGGLTSTPKIRIVNVVLPPDVDSPVITLNGDSSIQLDEDEDYVEQGATWTDNRDGSGSVTDITTDLTGQALQSTTTNNYSVIAEDASTNDVTGVTISAFHDEDAMYVMGNPFLPEGDGVWRIDLQVVKTNSSVIDVYAEFDSSYNRIIDAFTGTRYGLRYEFLRTGYGASPDYFVCYPVWSETPTSTTILSPEDPATSSTLNSLSSAYLRGFRFRYATAGDVVHSNVRQISYSAGSAIGSYTVTYNFTDTAGNSATPVTRTITVVDSTLPVITLNGDSSMGPPPDQRQLSAGSTYTEEGATWTDNIDGSGNVTDITGSVDTGTLGAYTITYSYTDSAGNTGTATRTITVVDSALPTITLNGSNLLEVDEDTTYTEQGATWSDNIDGFGAVTDITTDLDITTPGTYTVRYNYTDTSGNKATEVVRTITVVAVDVTPPSIQVLGNNPVTLVEGQTYTEYGASWLDDFDGNGTVTDVTGSVNINTAGTYTITYSYTDAAGNTASDSRTVNVVANDPIYVYSEPDGGFFYPLYRYSFGLSAYHEHVLGGVTYYMRNSDTLGVENEDWAHGHHLFPSSTLGLEAGTPSPTDSDYDGVPDDFDYWPSIVFMKHTQEELDAYLADQFKVIETRDVVKILVTNGIGDAGDYVYVTTIYSSPEKYKFVRSDGTTYNDDDALASNRGSLWEVYTDPSLPRSAHPDSTAPVISVTGDEITYLDLNEPYVEQGATWTDNEDGSGSVTDITGTVDTSTEGQYTVTYEHTDNAGNAATKVRYIRIVQLDQLGTGGETTYFPGINNTLGGGQITEQLVVTEEESTFFTTTTARPEVGDIIRYTGADAHGYVQDQLYVVLAWSMNSSAIGGYYWTIADRFGFTMPVTLMGSRDGNHQPTPGEPRTYFTKVVLADISIDNDGDGLSGSDDYFFGTQGVSVSEVELEALPTFPISNGSIPLGTNHVVAKYTGATTNGYFQGSWYQITRQRWNYITNAYEYTAVNKAGITQSVPLIGNSSGPTNGSNPLTNWDARQLPPDTDGDFIRDDADYFYKNASYTLTKADLDARMEDNTSALQVGDVVKMIHRILTTQENGEYYIVIGAGSRQRGNQGYKDTWILESGGDFPYSNETYVWQDERGIAYEKIVPSTAQADDFDGDSVLNNDEYFQYSPNQTVSLLALQTNYGTDTINSVTPGSVVVVTATNYITNATQGEYLIYKGTVSSGHVFQKGNGEYALINTSTAPIESYRVGTFNLLEFKDSDYDYDGVDNNDDYFERNAAWTVTQNDLDTLYFDDATRPYLLVGDILEVKTSIHIYGTGVPEVGEYIIYKGKSTAWPYKHEFERGNGVIYGIQTSYINAYLPGGTSYSFMPQTTRVPLADDDGDYVDNDMDYFYGISDLHYTQAELDRFTSGIKPTPIEVGDVIKYRFNSGLVYGFPQNSYWRVASITPWGDTGQYTYVLTGRDGTNHPQTLIGSLYGPGDDGGYSLPTRPRNIYGWETSIWWVDLEDVPQTIEYHDFNTLTFGELTAYKGEMTDNGWSGSFVLTSQGYRLRTGGPVNFYAVRTLTVTPGLRYRIEADLGTIPLGPPTISVGTSVFGSEITSLIPSQGLNTLDFTTNESSVIITFHNNSSGEYADYNTVKIRTLPYPESYFGYSKFDLDTITGTISGGGLPTTGTIIKGIAPNSEPIIEGEYYRVTGEIPGVGWTCEDAYGSSTYWTGQPYEIYQGEQGTTFVIPNLDHLP